MHNYSDEIQNIASELDLFVEHLKDNLKETTKPDLVIQMHDNIVKLNCMANILDTIYEEIDNE